MPVTDEVGHGKDVCAIEILSGTSGGQQPPADDPSAKGGGYRGEDLDIQRSLVVCRGLAGLVGQGVERVGVVAQRICRARQTVDDPRTERSGQVIEHPPHAHARESLVEVVRIGPRLEPEGLQHFPGCRANDITGQVEQGPAPQPIDARHRRERSSTGSTRKTQQHRLGLIVLRMPEDDSGRRALDGMFAKYCVASLAGRGLGATRATDLGTSHRRRDAEKAAGLCGPCRNHRRVGLQTVIDDDCADLPAALGANPPGSGREGQ